MSTYLELLPCPFCGNQPRIHHHATHPSAWCATKECPSSNIDYIDLNSPAKVAAWNTRSNGRADPKRYVPPPPPDSDHELNGVVKWPWFSARRRGHLLEQRVENLEREVRHLKAFLLSQTSALDTNNGRQDRHAEGIGSR